MKSNFEVVENLNPINLKNSNSLVYTQILKNCKNGKVFLYDKTNDINLTEEFTEILPIEIDTDNLFLLVNIDGKCGIYDVTSDNYAYKPIYDSVRFIDSENSVQRIDGKTYMCVLELCGNSGLFTFTKNNGEIIDRESLIPVSDYDDIQTNLFTQNINSIYIDKGFKKILKATQRMLFIEVSKDKKKGCFVIKNNTIENDKQNVNNGKFETIIEVPIIYDKIRPSEFNGVDGLDNKYIDGDEVYLYETTQNFIGSKNGVYSPIQRKIVLNDSQVISTLKKGLLLCANNEELYGVLMNGKQIVPSKFAPQIILEEYEKNDDYIYKFLVVDKTGTVYDYKSTIHNWKENLTITQLNNNEECKRTEKFIDDLLNGFYNMEDKNQTTK